MPRVLFVLVFVCVVAVFSPLAAEETSQPAGVEAKIGFSAGDVLSSPGFALKPEISWDILSSGITVGINDWTVPLLPVFNAGELRAYEEYGFDLGETPFCLAFGNANPLYFSDPFLADGYLYGVLGLKTGDADVAAFELDVSYLNSSAFAFGLDAVAGAGYTFSFGGCGDLGLWVDFNFALMPVLTLGDIEGTVEYIYHFEPCYISLAVEPVLTPGDTWALSIEPVLSIGAAF